MRTLLSVLRTVLSTVIRNVVGKLSWTPPAWLQWSFRKASLPVVRGGQKYWALRKEDPNRFRKVSLISLVALLAMGFGVYTYVNLPKPYQVTFNILEPAPTELRKGARPNPLIVRFSGSAAPVTSVGKVISKGLEVSPAVDGTWTWASDSELKLLPNIDWDVGKEYYVKFNNRFFSRGVNISAKNFKFVSPKFVVTPNGGEFYEDPTDPKNKQAVFTVKFTHPVNKSDFEKHVSLKMRVEPVKSFDNELVRNLGFKVVYNEDSSIAYVRSEQISIPANDGEVLASISKGVHASRGGEPGESDNSYSVNVPGIETYFKVVSVGSQVITNQKSYEAEKILLIESTASVEQREYQKNVEAFLLPADKKLYAEVAEQENYEESSQDCEDGEGCGIDSSVSIHCPLRSVGQVTDAVLAKATKLALTWVPSEHEYEKLHSAKYEAPDDSCLLIRIKKGTKANGGYELASNPSFLTVSPQYPPDVQIMHKGALLSITGEKKLSVMSRNLATLRVRMYRVLPNSLHHIANLSWGSFEDPQFYSPFGPDNMSQVFDNIVTAPPARPGRPSYSVVDFSTYLNAEVPRGLFIIEVSGWNESLKTTIGPIAKRMVLISDLGFLVKKNEDSTEEIFALSVRTGQPVAEAEVNVLGKNGLPVFQGKTDATGRVSLPKLTDLELEKTPAIYSVSLGQDLSFMPFNRNDRALNFSRFDVGGLDTNPAPHSLQGYLFSDRGIYRPGEDGHLGMIVKSNNWAPLPAGVPLVLTETDPRGIEIRRESIKFGVDGYEEFNFTVPDSALTGAYQFSLSVLKKNGEIVFLNSTSIRVEEFLPDRLKISATLSSEQTEGWISPEGIKGRASLRNLFGTPAAGNRIKGKMWLSPASLYFAKYPGYFFYDVMLPQQGITDELGEVATNDTGEAEFDLKLNRFEAGTYRLSYMVEGFEKESGRSVTANTSTVVSPLPFVIGVKPEGDKSYIRKGSKFVAQLVALSPAAKPVTASDLEIELIERKFVSTLTKLDSGSLAYQSVEKKISISKGPLSISEQGQTLTLPTTQPGDFIYEIRNTSGTLQTKFLFTVVGEGNPSNSLEQDAELQIKLEKTDYQPGDEIELEIQAPYKGAGLITIEREKVYAHSWFKAETNSSIQHIKVPSDLEGNGYVNVSFVRSLESPEIFTSPLSYGVKPFTVSRDRRTETVTLKAEEQVKPGETINIQVATAEPARTVVFAADEGILQVARYKTPDPLSHFFQKRALNVSTSQILDLLLPEFELVQKLSAAGGDDDALLARQRNPFKRKTQKPVVLWSGILETGTAPKTVSLSTPDYFNGKVRIYALSVSNTRVGVATKETTVQGDIVLSPNVALVAAPGDELEVSTVVTNLRGGGDKIKVSLQTDSKLSLQGAANQDLEIPLGKDQVAVFKIRATSELGSSNLVFRAKGPSAEAKYSIDLSVRPSSPRLTSIQFGSIKSGLLGAKAKDIKLTRQMHPEESSREIAVSTVPLGLADGLRRYLEFYPHGCSEQVASQLYPLIVLGGRPEFKIPREKVSKGAERAFAILGSRQKENGSFRTWPGYDEEDRWLSLHIARILLESQERNILPPKILFDQAFNYVKEVAISNETYWQEARNRAFAIYLLTKSGVVTTNYLQTLKEGLEQQEDKSWKKDLTALYMAATYQLLKMESEANEFVGGVSLENAIAKVSRYDDGVSGAAHLLTVYSKHFPERAKKLPPEFFLNIAERLNGREYSTISSADLILALDDYQKALGSPESFGFRASVTADSSIFSPLSFPEGFFVSRELTPDVKAIRLEASEKTSTFYQTSESGFDLKPGPDISKRIEILREYTNQKGEKITSANVGDDVRVRIVLRTTDGSYDPGQVAVVDLLPAGFELQGGTQNLSSSSGEGSFAWSPAFVDAREDRALLYGNIGASASEYVYTVKAVTKGNFVVPPILVEAMYDQSSYAQSSAGTFTVR